LFTRTKNFYQKENSNRKARPIIALTFGPLSIRKEKMTCEFFNKFDILLPMTALPVLVPEKQRAPVFI
jgi:hypothetical protein